ncbi:cobyrinate a,c-diamide synthase [Halalkalibacter akibai]|uniref:Cobyrinate a,c-diamide synthase n=1 Tax=Halalkalibacter akibai (strain ATCC 43226 / DSM 21942 / CIP 109018 / JCM 9157 / 1139) TaxID=1236973 RepID=W4QWS7_HALA3|nr:cobyrinate a,c-diamide synthase [Halalkalibacter akibai]GAE36098.1 cobyrinic acid A,C-diamide synthase [Halalkalibacter akibai JCM 9157]
MTERRIVIAGTGSGVGKTTLTIGLMSALQKRGLSVQGFKCGPDYIDPSYHTAVTGRVSRNLDSWMLEKETVLDIFKRGSKGADVSIIEGVMGFFDGKNPKNNEGSTADISMITESPVILVVNCASMARSAAAIVKGFQLLAEGPNIVGVIANRVGSEGHFKIVKTAIEQECKVPVIGYLKRELDIEIPERHLGLIPSIERGELDPFFDQLGDLVSKTIDLDQILELSDARPLSAGHTEKSIFEKKKDKFVRIAVAKDAAFNFYYPENLELLQSYGAEIVFFSPLANEPLPEDVDGLYLGGGFPEEYAQQLSENNVVKQSISTAIINDLPTLAECGGFMYLTESIETTDQSAFQMVGLIPGHVKMQKNLAALGYREITGQRGNFLISDIDKARGHEFHYSTFHCNEEVPYAYETKGMRGTKQEGYMIHNLIAGYTHFHFASCAKMVENWIDKCSQRKECL